MTAAATVLFVAAFLIFAWPLLFLAVLDLRDRLHDRSDARRREQQGREVSAEWLAVLAAVEPEVPALPRRRPSDCTPIYDALVCARIEKEEGWTA